MDPQEKNKKQDPLLSCLLTITRLLDKPYSVRSLLSGLPVSEKKLTLDLFIRAARRANLDAKVIKQSLNKITNEHLPVVLLLKNREACVLTKLNTKKAHIIKENTRQETIIDLGNLENDYAGYTIFLKKGYRFDERAQAPKKLIERHWFWSVISKAWPIYSEVIIASFLINLFAVAVPLFVLNVYDRVIPNNAVETLWVLSIGMLIIIGFEFAMRNLRGYFIDRAGKNIDAKLSASTFEQALNLRMSDRPGSVGGFANTMISFEHFRDFITSASVSLLVDIPFVLIFIAVIWMLSTWIVIVPVVAIPLVLIISFLIQKPIERMVQNMYRHNAEKQAVLVESLMGAETLKTLCAEGPVQNKWENITQSAAILGAKLRQLVNFGINSAISIQFLSTIIVVIIGVYAIGAGKLTIGGLIACTILNGRALAPIVQLAGLLIRYKQTKSSLNAIDNIMHLETERPKNITFIQKTKLKGDIKFEEVSLVYPNQPMPAIDEISFHISSGEHVGIIGPAGSGKSSILKLILKLYQPTTGRILIDDTDITHLDPAELRYQIGYIPQNVMLFHGSVRDNVIMPAPHIDDDALLRAIELSGAQEFVYKHPDGIDRQVGERGSLLSGGQQQALAVARALVLNPPIYLFDEPTSSLDNTSINHFIQSMRKEFMGKTAIIISHKANVLTLVDTLMVMDNGKIIAHGPKEKIISLLTKQKQQVTKTHEQP